MYADEFIWSQKYRPTKLEDCVLPSRLKKSLRDFLDKKSIINCVFAGTAGTGKTTAALAIADELGAEVMFLNCSGEDRGIDTVKHKIMNFATRTSLESEGRKLIICDEADSLTMDSQLALRATIEIVSENCGFILTCNYENKLIEPLRSRCPVFKFNIPKEEKIALQTEIGKRIYHILKKEGVNEIDKTVLQKIIKKYFPDYRKTINVLQQHGSGGTIDVSILGSIDSAGLDDLIEYIQDKNFTAARKWIAEYPAEPIEAILLLNQNIDKYFSKSCLASVIVALHKAQLDDALSIDKELSFIANLAEIMSIEGLEVNV